MLTRYDRTHTEITIIKGRNLLYSVISRNRRHTVPCRATWGSTRVSQEVVGEREMQAGALFYFRDSIAVPPGWSIVA